MAGDYFISYAMHNVSAKQDWSKIYAVRIIYTFSCAICIKHFEQKIA